jgi:hypothetical protein
MYNSTDDMTVFISLKENINYVEYVWSTPGIVITKFKPQTPYDIYDIEKK